MALMRFRQHGADVDHRPGKCDTISLTAPARFIAEIIGILGRDVMN
jgi:hypothetical protein